MNNISVPNMNVFKTTLISAAVFLGSTMALAFEQIKENKPSKLKKCFHGSTYHPESVCLGVTFGGLSCEIEFESGLEWLHVNGEPGSPEHDNPEECVVSYRPTTDLDCLMFDNPIDIYTNDSRRF